MEYIWKKIKTVTTSQINTRKIFLGVRVRSTEDGNLTHPSALIKVIVLIGLSTEVRRTTV